MCRVLKREKYHPFKPIRVHEEEVPLNGQHVPLTSQHVTIGYGGYLKEKVYARKPQDVDMLKLVIEEEIRSIPLNMYHNAMNDFPKRCQLCLDVNGEEFEAIK